MDSDAKRTTIHALTVLALAFAPACALKPPAQNSGQVQSYDGVALAITGQSCSLSRETEEVSWDLVGQRLAIEVQNGSPDPITVHPDKFRVALPDGSALETVTWGAATPVAVASGEHHVFKLRFMANSDFTCETAMRLDAGGAITRGEQSVALGGVSFVPHRAL